ncbi:MAG TPA: acetylxylan esterase [Phycisphaerales bacterium]|nr:acetylxylan esterase [Phycisphaerales bacterium]
MHLPDNFGFSGLATLAHVGSRAPSWRHASFWNAWEKAIGAENPALMEIEGEPVDTTDPTATHRFVSSRNVGIGCTLVTPPAGMQVRAGLVTVHGYSGVGPLAGDRERWEHLAACGVATLAIRLRGFAGSAGDIGLKTDTDEGWAAQGLAELIASEDAALSLQLSTWIVPQAVGDIVNAVRALSRWIGRDVPMMLHGESLGGGLAVIAAARGRRFFKLDRMAIELPSFGDWLWRLGLPATDPPREPAGSAGLHIRTLWRRYQDQLDHFNAALRLCDAVVHALEITAPTLCKLAERDEVSPAPSAAAVYNAIGTEMLLKWRFIVPYGHFDGGIRAARRHALFERATDLFLDPSLLPVDAMRLVEPILLHGDRMPEEAQARLDAVPRPAASAGVEELSLFGSAAPEPAAQRAVEHPPSRRDLPLERVLTDAYKSAARTLDDLPYTDEFAAIMAAAHEHTASITDREVFHKLHNMRKAGRLPKLGRAAASKPAVRPEDERLLIELVEEAVGSTGQRDQLPYTEQFNRLVWEFNRRTARELHPHEVWRLVATLSK